MIYGIRHYSTDTGLDFEELRDFLECKCKAEFLESLCAIYTPYPIFYRRWYREFLLNAQYEILLNHE
jgi:hypothetical protein